MYILKIYYFIVRA